MAEAPVDEAPGPAPLAGQSSGSPSAIAGLEVATWRVPLPRPWGEDVPAHHLTTVTLTDDQGRQGAGFTWTPQIGASSVHAMVVDECAPAVVGWPTDPELVWDRLFVRLREAGGTGITTLAMAAVDIALWDLAGRCRQRSLVDLLGRRHDQLPVYGSGVNFHYSVPELEEQARRWVAAGHEAVKMKVGRADLDEDLDRVRRVADIIGPDRRLMLDANQRWTLEQAKRAASAFEVFNPVWLEEPLPADDLWAHAELRGSTTIPLALGENLSNHFQFRQALEIGACDVVQPNVTRVGGITPFQRIAKLAHRSGAQVAPHLLPDLSAQLALCLPGPTMVEDVEDASWTHLGILERPSGVVLGSTARADTGPGHGLALNPAAAPGAERLA